MDYQLEDIGPTRKKLAVEIPLETVETEINQLVGDLKKKAKIPGFRPGKAPVGMIKKMFWAHIEQEVATKLMSESLPEALEKAEVEPISQPTLEDSNFKGDEPFKFSVSFDVKPVFEISGYEGLDLTRETFNVTDEMVDKKLEELRQAFATIQSLEEDRPILKGDLAVLDYQGFVDGEPLEGGSNPNYQLEVGTGRFHPDFEAGLIGLAKDEEKEIEVEFAEDHYNPKLAGKKVNFKVKVVDIKEKRLPELNDDFAKDVAQDIEGLEDLTNRLREDLVAEAERRVQGLLNQQVREKLLGLVDFEVPESMVAQELDSMISSTEFNMKRSGFNLEAMGITPAKLKEEYHPEAGNRVKAALILELIAKEKGLEVTDEEVDDAVMKTAKSTGQPPEVVKDIYIKNNMMDSLKDSLLTEKTLKYILDAANIEDVPPSSETDAEEAASDEENSGD